jgi:hypothetical protein
MIFFFYKKSTLDQKLRNVQDSKQGVWIGQWQIFEMRISLRINNNNRVRMDNSRHRVIIFNNKKQKCSLQVRGFINKICIILE